jgi:2-phospho-L-lactate guanylyltransferase
MSTLAILPIKRFDRAKQRLTGELAPGARQTLAEAMVGDVLEALGAVEGIASILVVTSEPRAATLAQEAGAEVVEDHHESGQSAAAQIGVAIALEREHNRVLLVPGDCPALDAGEVERLLASSARDPRTVIVPDRHGTGTNALVLCPPDIIEPSFGPGSRARHEARAQQAGAAHEVITVPSLALDVDTAGDLAALTAALELRPGGAARTRAVLAELSELEPETA